MLGGPFPERLDVTARIDADGDGNARTRSPDDLIGLVSNVEAGSTGLVLELRRAGP